MHLVAEMYLVTSGEAEAGPAASTAGFLSRFPRLVFQFCHIGRKKTFGDSPEIACRNLMSSSPVSCEALSRCCPLL